MSVRSNTFSPLTPALSPLRGKGENRGRRPKLLRRARGALNNTKELLLLRFLKGEGWGEGSRSDDRRGNS